MYEMREGKKKTEHLQSRCKSLKTKRPDDGESRMEINWKKELEYLTAPLKIPVCVVKGHDENGYVCERCHLTAF